MIGTSAIAAGVSLTFRFFRSRSASSSSDSASDSTPVSSSFWLVCADLFWTHGPTGSCFVPPLPQGKARALDNQLALDRSPLSNHSFGSRKMSEHLAS